MPGEAAVTVSEKEALSLHETILRDIEDRILSGSWPPGHRIPPEQELSREYGCSRMTVNKVMTQLAAAGLVLRRRKTGSVVMPQRSQNAVLEIHDVRDDVLAQDQRYSFEVLHLATRRVAAAERKTTRLSAGQRVAAVDCLHRGDGVPFCLEERIINLAVVPEAEHETFAELSPGPWLVQHIPWSEAENSISATGAGATTAASLGLAPGAPCLVIERRTWRQGELVTQVRFTYPGATHQLRARFTPSQN